jgi:hypothetical protein
VTTAIVVLAHAPDSGAASVVAWLARELGPEIVRVVRPEALSRARWSHHIDAHGRASTRLTLPDAEPLVSAEASAVLNRIRYLPMPGFRRASAKDRDYAGAELQAVVASWLASFGDRAIHAVRRHPWVTPMLPLQLWASAAAACGLPVAARTIANSTRVQGADSGVACGDEADLAKGVSAGTVLVAGSDVGGALVDRYGTPCLAAARLLGFPLMEFRFAVEGHNTRLVWVDPLPPLVEPWAAALTGKLLRSLLREESS